MLKGRIALSPCAAADAAGAAAPGAAEAARPSAPAAPAVRTVRRLGSGMWSMTTLLSSIAPGSCDSDTHVSALQSPSNHREAALISKYESDKGAQSRPARSPL